MNKISISTINLILILTLFSCVKKTDNHALNYKEQQKVVVAGRIFPFIENKTSLSISVDRIGIGQKEYITDIDEDGYFEMSFTTVVPTDLWMRYNANFSLAVMPNDSLFVSWDGTKNNRPEILSTLEVYSKESNINEGIINYQKAYFTSQNYSSLFNENEEAIKTLNSQDYKLFADSLHQQNMGLIDSVFENFKKDDYAYNWAKLRALESYFYCLAFYPMFNARANEILVSEVKLDSNYSSFWTKIPEIDPSNIASAHAISGISNKYLFNQIGEKARKNIEKLKASNDSIKIGKNDYSKFYLEAILENAPDEFWKQVLITEFIYTQLESFNFEFYELYKEEINNHLQYDFLRNPITEKYASLVNESKNPTNYSNQNNFKEEDVIAEIAKKHTNKTVYIDVWATWCGPCRSEFKYANILKDELSDHDIIFAYICIDSEENAWKTATNHFQLKGEHYFLSEEKTKFIKEQYQVNGVPTYMIIKKNGDLMRNVKYRPSNNETVSYLKSISSQKNI